MDKGYLAPRWVQTAGDERVCAAGGPFGAAAACGYVRNMVANGFGVDPRDLTAPTRGQSSIAFARQVAMYLAHVTCGLNLTDVGRCFDRDRTTVAHACEQVEDRRDVPATDLALDYMEVALAMWLAASGTRACGNDAQMLAGREV